MTWVIFDRTSAAKSDTPHDFGIAITLDVGMAAIRVQRRAHHFTDRSPTLEPGEVVLADCRNSLEDRASRGKFRPMVVIRREDGHLRALGLTTNPAFLDGTPRVAIPNPTSVGLLKRGFLWGDRLTRIYVGDVEKHLGMADRALVEAIIGHVHLDEADRQALEGMKLFGEVA